jgi:cytochrome c2
MKCATRSVILAVLATATATVAMDRSWAGDPVAGKAIFDRICHTCHAALPYFGRIGEANLPQFLANPKRYSPKTAMTFPGLQRRKDIDDVIAYITEGR